MSECALCISAASLLVLWRSRHTCLQGTLNIFLRSARGLLDYRNQVTPRFCAGYALHTCSWVSAQRGGHQAHMRLGNYGTGISVQPTMQHTPYNSLYTSSGDYRASSTAPRVFLPCEYENRYRQLASRQQDPSARATNIIQIIALTSSDTDKAAIERSYRCAEHVERTALKQTRNAVEDKW